MRIASAGHAVYAVLMIGLGIQGLIMGDFTTVWQPVPRSVPAREVLVYVCALLSLASGIGLLSRRMAGPAARVLLGFLVLWILAWRVRGLVLAPLVQGSWSFADTAVMAAGAWVLSRGLPRTGTNSASASPPATRASASRGCSTAWG